MAPLTIAQALACASRLKTLSDTPDLDAQLLLGQVLDRSRTYLYTWPERELTGEQAQRFLTLLARRERGEPVAHILGYREFWSLTLEVSPDTLIPRPETELLVELALELGADTALRVLDLGSGTGAIALALASERPGWEVLGVDRVANAVALAERNRERLGLSNARFAQGNWCEGLSAPFDLVLSNPPYIDPADPHLEQGDVRFEPRSALVAEDAGLADIRTIAEQARRLLYPAGWLLIEHGYQQGEAVRTCLESLGYQHLRTQLDLGGQPRVTLGQWCAAA